MTKPNKDSPQFYETALLESAKIKVAITKILKNPFPTINEYYDVILSIFPAGDETQHYLDIFREIDQNNANIYDYPELMHEFRSDATRHMQTLATEGGDLTTVGYRRPESLEGRTPRYLMVDNVFTMGMQPGRAGVVWGIPGSGKTDLCVSEIYRTAVKKSNWKTVYNIKIKNPAKNSMYATVLSDSLLAMVEYALGGEIEKRDNPESDIPDKNNCWIFDEAQRDRDRQTSGKRENITQKHLSLVLRKLNCFQWLVYQQNKPPSEVAEFASHWIEKTSATAKGNANYRNDILNARLEISRIKGLDARKADGMEYYEYETKHFAGLHIDIFVDKMFAFIASLGDIDVIEYYQEIIKYIKKCRGESSGLIDRDMEAEMAFIIHERYKDAKDKLDRKVSGISYLAHLFGWDKDKTKEAARRELSRAFEKIRESGGAEIKDPHDITNMSDK